MHLYINCTGVNFEVLMRVSDNDLKSTGPASDGLMLAPFSPVISPASRPSAGNCVRPLAFFIQITHLISVQRTMTIYVSVIGLGLNGDLSLDGDVDITIPAAQCRDALWFCINVEPGTGADYGDSNPSNNWECYDISEAKSCATGKIVFLYVDSAIVSCSVLIK